MDAARSDISALSETISRTEHMGYLTTVLGMDRASASLLYRAEKLQEKGQLHQALKYSERVLETCPGCVEATENMRIVKELLQDSEQERLSSISEIRNQESSPPQPIITEMDVNWTWYEDVRVDYYPDPDECSFDNARPELRKAGCGRSLLKLIENKTLSETRDHNTGSDRKRGGDATRDDGSETL